MADGTSTPTAAGSTPRTSRSCPTTCCGRSRTWPSTGPRDTSCHASAVARDGVAVVFAADADSGKSTLATILVEAGFDYLTDEATAIDLDTGEVVGYPKPITLDPGSQQLLVHLDPGGLQALPSGGGSHPTTSGRVLSSKAPL